MKRFGLTLLFLTLIIGLLAVQPPELRSQAAPNPPTAAGEVDPALTRAVQDKFASQQKGIQAIQPLDFTIDTLIPSQDGAWALLWLAPVDPESGEVIATEPRLAIAHLLEAATDEWQVTLSTDAEWSQVVAQLPADLLPEQVAKITAVSTDEPKAGVQAVLRGYKLPWASGQQKRLSGSIGHFLIYNSCSESACRYAYDFADGTMFPLLAAKGGTVYTYKDSCPNGSNSCTNYLVLKDESTIPTTWQIYYHMAYGSIPSSLKNVGEPVVQGQYIGNVDDTGFSSGHHLHFHVTNYLYWYTNYYETVPWGWSVDIRFDDVSINDGTPRTCYEARNYPGYGSECIEDDKFTSGNVGAHPPSGSLSLPASGEVVTGPGLTVAGSAADDIGVTKVQVIARGRDRIWRDVGSPLTSVPFTTSVDLCSASVPDGPVDIALRIWDIEGNVAPGAPGLRTVVKNYACAPPPPACTPTADKIVLYSEPNYQGACREFEKEPSGGEILVRDLATEDTKVGDNNAASIMVGSNVRALLYTENAHEGRSEALEVSDPNLTDNRIGADTLSSLIVQWKNKGVGSPIGFSFPPPDTDSNPGAEDVTFSGVESLSASMYAKGAATFSFELYRKEGANFVLAASYPNLTQPVVSLGSLPAGFYRLRGKGNNSSGASYDAAPIYFTVDSASLQSADVKSVPYVDAMDANTGEWQATGGWNHATLNDGHVGWRFSGYSSPSKPINYGSLTSPPVALPAGASYLRFSYRADTEDSYPFWDQRRVQISVDDGPFQDVQVVENGGPLQAQQADPLWDDAQEWWLVSPAIDLSAYAGRTVRVRFYFFTADELFSSGGGWEINDVSITSEPDDNSCVEAARNDRLATATQVSLGQTVTGQFICPRGDVDFYKFNGNAGQKIAFRVAAGANGSNLDPYIYLLDGSGGLIAENDDIDSGVVRDSALGLTLPYTGVYYLKVKAWNHPAAGGPDYFYTLRLESDITPPVSNIAYPANIWIPGAVFEASAAALDSGSGVARVDFYWHNPDWLNGSWELIGSDADGSDGWSKIYDLSTKGNLTNSGIYIEARDAADNIWGAMLLGLRVDTEKPVSQMSPLPGEMGSTALQLRWSAYDAGSGLGELNLQFRQDGAAWQDWLPNPLVGSSERWFLGQFGQTYDFRMRAKDKANLLEDYPANPEASTRIEGACNEDDFDRNLNGDDSRDYAAYLPLGMYQGHNLCGLGDADWVFFPGQAGVELLIAAASNGGGAAVNLEIYNSAGDLLATAQAADLGRTAALVWTPPVTGNYYLKVTPLVEGLAGSDARYSLWAGPPKKTYLVTIGR